jgi:hypothetical protein
MRKNLALLLALFCLGIVNISCLSSSSASSTAGANNTAVSMNNDKTPSPVLVELFTSEGCNSCPPADKALAFLDKNQPVSGAQIIVLELHVDYFDGPGWKDPFGSPNMTERQHWYAQKFKEGQIYTPQMVVDGSRRFVGSDLQTANISITELAKDAKAKIALTNGDGKLKIKIDPLAVTKDATVFLAIAENNLESNVGGGENSGVKLAHTAVVRQLGAVGSLKPDNKGLEADVSPHFQDGWKKNDLKAVVFIQDNESGRVLGVSQLSLAEQK